MATLKELIDRRLSDACPSSGPARQAAMRYYLGLIREDLRLTEGITAQESLDANEGMVLGFLKGYEARKRA
jgi:hypothetical protein